MIRKPLCIDLFCGLGGWAAGFLAEGYDVVGFDIDRHVYGEHKYPAQLVLQDVLTLQGSQFRNATIIVASPPCQGYSYQAMPWKRAKALPPPDNILFESCLRIAYEAGVPLIIENVRGAQKWVGRAKWHYGSFYLWGDVPALMPATKHVKVPGVDWHNYGKPGYTHPSFRDGIKIGGSGDEYWRKPLEAKRREATAIKNKEDTFGWSKNSQLRNSNSNSSSRKAASALIAKIPFELSSYIARCFMPRDNSATGGL